jgi:hypothetical protein
VRAAAADEVASSLSGPPSMWLLSVGLCKEESVCSTCTAGYSWNEVENDHNYWGTMGTMLKAGRSRVRDRWREWIFSIYLILPAAVGPGVHLASNRNKYQKQKKKFLGNKVRVWTVGSLYRAEYLMTVSRELSKHELDLLGVQEVIWEGGGTDSAGEYTFSTERGMRIMN